MKKVLFVIAILIGALNMDAQQVAELNRDNSAAISFLPYNGNSVFHISHGLDNKLYFSNGSFVGGAKMLTLVNTGYFGIGTTTPRSHLDVDGTIYWKTSKLTADQGGSISLRGNGTTPYFDFSNDLTTSYDARFMLTDDDHLYLAGAKLGIGTPNPDEMLTVNGNVHAKEILVDLNIPPDYVFQKYYTGFSSLDDSYKMPTLEEVEAYTKKHHHLPEVPSASEIQKEGLHLKEMTSLLLQKIEELTLYTIEQEKRIKKLEEQLSEKK